MGNSYGAMNTSGADRTVSMGAMHQAVPFSSEEGPQAIIRKGLSHQPMDLF